MKDSSKNRMVVMLIFATGILSCLATVSVEVSQNDSYSESDRIIKDSPEESGYYHAVDNKNSDIKFAPYTKAD